MRYIGSAGPCPWKTHRMSLTHTCLTVFNLQSKQGEKAFHTPRVFTHTHPKKILIEQTLTQGKALCSSLNLSIEIQLPSQTNILNKGRKELSSITKTSPEKLQACQKSNQELTNWCAGSQHHHI